MLGERELVSIVGGGGKTTTLFALGRQLAGSTILTTTTKMGSDRDEGVPVLVAPDDATVAATLREHGSALVWSERAGHRAEGVSPADCNRWFLDELAPYVIVEADGSRRRPFKAPYAYEPVVPTETTTLVACIGISALGQRIDECCHRPDAVTAIVGGHQSDVLTPAKAAAALLSEAGSRKGRPDGARYVVLAQQVRDDDRSNVEALAAELADQVQLIAVEETTEPT